MLTGTSAILVILGVFAAIVVGAFVVMFLIVPLAKGLWWLVKHVCRFVAGEIGDLFRFIGATVLAVLYIPMILGCIVIARWSASAHYGRALRGEVSCAGACLYRMVIGHPARLIGLSGMTEGIEQRLPAVLANAPTSDKPTSRTGQFDGYTIVGSLPSGGSGAKLYVAEPDAMKLVGFDRDGLPDVGQVVIKSFSLEDGSSLPQIVRESRSLDAAKKLGLILDHDLTHERFYYVMRYVPGEPLGMIVKRLHAESGNDGLDDPHLRIALQYTADLLATLSTYHRGGLWHKDVKPDNVIVDTQSSAGRAHLVDFGLVTALRSAMTLTTHGTEYFRDPEMVRMAIKGVKVAQIDGSRFDIYGAGAVLYSCLEDSFPAHGVLSNMTKRCPEAVRWIIRRAMTDYDKRYVSAEQMLADVRYVLTSARPAELRPADLPSMNEYAVPVGGAVGVAVPPPIPPVAGFAVGAGAAVGVAAAAHGAQRVVGTPRLRVTNWWSGEAEVVGYEPAAAQAKERHSPQTPEEWGRAAGQYASRGVAAAGSAWSSFRDGFAGVNNAEQPVQQSGGEAVPMVAVAGAAIPDVPLARAATPEVPLGVRARAAAVRTRAQQRAQARRAEFPKRRFDNGINRGVGVALAVFLGAVIGVGMLMSNRSAVVESEDHRVAATAREHEMIADAAEQAIANAAHDGEEDASSADAVEVRNASHQQGDTKKTTTRDARSRRSAPAAPPMVSGRVLLVVDMLRPWSDEIEAKIVRMERGLTDRGLTVLATHHAAAVGPVAPQDDESLRLTADVRLALGTVGPETTAGSAAIASWLGSVSGGPDSVIWIAPPENENSQQPRVVSVSQSGDGEIASAVAAVLVESDRGGSR